MFDLTNRFGRHVNRRLRQEKIIWLTTVDSHTTPQPRPVWFHWDGEAVMIFSERDKAKLRHLAHNCRVALNFNTDDDGGDVAVIVGDARILGDPPPSNRIKAYLRKYSQGIKSLDMSVAAFRAAYSVSILVTPVSMRGFVD
jgi:PPOX class probable F420-dependent enzyme